jgi:tRNA (guanine-N7-)-methyltransferase
MTQAQRAEVAELLARYGLVPRSTDARDFVASSHRGVIVEIGFGLGDATFAMATAAPDTDVIAVDIHTPGVLRLLRAVDGAALDNVRVVEGDGLELLDELPSGSLAGIRIYFPDPWPKASHRHRRLCSPTNVALFVDRLAPGATLHIATDIEPYARETEVTLRAHPQLTVERMEERPAWRASSKFERQGIDAGRSIIDLLATKAR